MPAPLFDPQSVVPYKAYYFCIFAGPAIVTTYLNLYFRRIGFSNSEVGWLSAIFALCGVLSPPVWGAISDCIGSKRKPGILLMGLSGILFPCFFWAHHLLLMAVLMGLLGVLMSPIAPLADAAAITHLQRHGGDYPRIRLWGSLGFMVAATTTGFLLHRASTGDTGLAAIFLIFPVWRIAGVWWATHIHEEPLESSRNTISLGGALLESAAIFRRRRAMLFTLCCFLGWGAMQCYYAFFTIYLDTRGAPDTTKGLYWDVAAISEILFLSQIGRVRERLGPEKLLAVGLAGQAVRLFLYSQPVPLWAIGLGQTLHACSFAACYVAYIEFLRREIPDRLRAGGQAVFMGIVTGLGGAVGSWLAGYAAHRSGLPAMFFSSALVTVGALALSIWLAVTA